MCNISTVIRLTIAIINAMLVSVLVGAIIDDDYKALFVAMVWNFIVSVAILIPAETDKAARELITDQPDGIIPVATNLGCP